MQCVKVLRGVKVVVCMKELDSTVGDMQMNHYWRNQIDSETKVNCDSEGVQRTL